MPKIKNWIIKKLGGYTADELQVYSPVINSERCNIVKLSSSRIVDMSYGGIPEEYLKSEMCHRISGSLEPFMTWALDSAGCDRKRITGILRVVEPSKDERETYDEYFENDF